MVRQLLLLEDTGPGIPEESLPNIFERFYQAEVKYRSMGSGLGTYFSKEHSSLAWWRNQSKKPT